MSSARPSSRSSSASSGRKTSPMARHQAFWVILAGAVPTAFRSPRREDLLPTLHQLQRTQPDVQLRWFDRGRVWESPTHAAAALAQRRTRQRDRGPGWRPGGKHEDPRAKYQLSRDEKRARFKKRLRRGPPDRPPERASGAGPAPFPRHGRRPSPYSRARDRRPPKAPK